MRATIVFWLVAALGWSASAGAQTVQRPTRPYRGLFGGGPPPDPNRTRHELTLTTSALGGYDDVISPGATPSPVEPNQIRQGGFSGFFDATLRYYYGRDARSLTIEGTAISSAYTNIDVPTATGGYIRLRGLTGGRRQRITAAQDFSFEPTLVLGGFRTLPLGEGTVPPPEAGGASGFVNQESRSSRSSATYSRDWTTRQVTTLRYDFFIQRYLDAYGIDNKVNSAGVQHGWAVTRANSIDASYNASRTELTDQAGLVTPLTNQRFDVGISHRRRLSPSRQLQISGGGGATYVSTINPVNRADDHYWTPSGYGSLRVDLGRSWALTGDYRRDVMALPGLSTESFSTDAARIGADGVVSRRFEVAMSAAFSNGSAGGADAASRFQIYTGLAQVRFAVSRCCAVAANYNYYFYTSADVTDLPTGFPSSYDRNAIRVGMTVLLPLLGSYTEPPQRRGGGGR